MRDIAVLTRVGRPTCFVIESLDTDETGQPVYRLSRAEAQRMCKADYLDALQPGDILPCTVTHIEPFGAFCDVGCGISALLPIDCMSVSRISSPADRVSVGQQILVRHQEPGPAGPLCADHPGSCWAPGRKTPPGSLWARPWWASCAVWRNTAPSSRSRPTWPALPRAVPTLTPGQAVSVYIKNILPEKMKIKLVIVNHALNQRHRFELKYFITEGHLDRWVYSTPESPRAD